MLALVCSWAQSEENIHTYIMNGDMNQVVRLLDEHPDYIHQRDAGFTPLIRSVAQGQKAITELFLARGADVNESVGESALYTAASSPLAAAVFYGHKDIAELLIKKGAHVNFQDVLGRTAVYMALNGTGNKKELLTLLIVKGAHVNGKIRPEGTCPAGARCDGPDHGGWTPLHLAVSINDKESVMLLIAAGAKLNTKDETGSTPIYLSHSWPQGKEITELLIAKGASVNVQDSSGVTPLLLALIHHDYPKARFLVEKGADVNMKADDGDSPLAVVFSAGYDLASASYKRSPENIAMVKLLVAKGADVSIANDGDPTWERLIGKHNR